MKTLVERIESLWTLNSPGNRVIRAEIIADVRELQEVLSLCLPTIEHEYHTNPDPDGSLWDRVKRARKALGEKE